MFPFTKVECPQCHAENKRGANFCKQCGGPLAGATVRCHSCNATVSAEAKFCAKCGRPLAETAAPEIQGNQWARRPEDFATRVNVTDVEGFFKKGLIVEAGTKALFFTNGAYSGIVEVGKHEMGGLLRKINNVFSSKQTTALLMDAADVELSFTVGDLATRDPVRLTAGCRVVTRLENPAAFFENLMKSRHHFPKAELEAFLSGEIRNALQEHVSARSVEELSSNLAVKEQMEQAVARHMAVTLERKGLALVQLRVLDLRHPRLNALTGKLEEYWLDRKELETELAAGEMKAGVERKVLDQQTARAVMELEVYEERAKVLERMQQAVGSAEMSKVRSADDLEKFLREIDKGKLIRDEELAVLKLDYADKREDRDLARRHLVELLRINQDGELKRARRLGELMVGGVENEHRRREAMAEVEHEIERDRKRRVGQLDLEREEHKRDVEEAIDGIELLRKMKELKAQEAEREQERQLRGRRQLGEIEISEEQARHALEMERLKTLSTLSAEALIATAPSDRAAMLADLKKTEAFRGMSEDQILAMAAEKSPEVARAFQEKFKAASKDVERLYERMLTETKELSREHARMTHELAKHALDTQRDTAVATARAGQPGMTVIGTGGGVYQTGGAGAAGRTVCPSCHREVPGGSNFCENCGHKFF